MSGYYASPDLDNLWSASTPDDGKSWNTPTKALTRPNSTHIDASKGAPRYNTESFYFQTMSAVRTYDDLILVAVEHINNLVDAKTFTSNFLAEPDSGARAALVIMQYNTSGADTPGKSSVIFKPTKPNLI